MGYSIEAVAYRHFETHKHSDFSGLLKGRDWGISRRPDDALAHMAFSQLLWDTPAFSPLALLGGLANNEFLRYMGRDKGNGSSLRNVGNDSS